MVQGLGFLGFRVQEYSGLGFLVLLGFRVFRGFRVYGLGILGSRVLQGF